MEQVDRTEKIGGEMISSFLSKLLTTRQASFTEEEIEIFDLNFTLQPLPSLVEFQKEVSDERMMERLGYLISETIIDHFKKRFAIEEKKMSDLWTKLIHLSGLGKIEVVDIKGNRTILKVEKNNFAKLYLEKYGLQKKPVCHLIKGIFKCFMEKLTGKKVEVVETSCIAMGNKVCTFEVRIIE